MTKRKYERDTERYPLATNDDLTYKYRWRRLLALWRVWGGEKSNYTDLAMALGYDMEKVRRWFGLGMFKGMESEAVEKVCELFNVSLEYLQNGRVYSRSQSIWDAHKPTTAESGRYDARGIADAYCMLEESEQRTITHIVNTMLELKIYKRDYIGALKDSKLVLEQVLSGDIRRKELLNEYDIVSETLDTEEGPGTIITSDSAFKLSDNQRGWSQGEEESIDQDIDNLKDGRLEEVSYLDYLKGR